MSEQTSRPNVPRVMRPPVSIEVAAIVLCLFSVSGCGKGEVLKRVPVDGYVTVDGNPLKSGSIRFIPIDDTKGPAAVAVIEDGIYELPAETGPVMGKLRVEIEATNHQGFDLDDEKAYAAKAEQGPPIAKNPVPETFNRQSTLSINLDEDGDSDLDFRLSSAGVLADSR